MRHADPWNEVARLDQLLDADLRAEIERSGVRAAAQSFCEDKCRVEGTCPLRHALHTQRDCPLWMYVEQMTSKIVPEERC